MELTEKCIVIAFKKTRLDKISGKERLYKPVLKYKRPDFGNEGKL